MQNLMDALSINVWQNLKTEGK